MAASYGPHEHRFAGMAWFGAEGMKVSWGGVFAGVLVAVGIAMLLAALGAAIGATTVAGPRGVGAAVWGEIQRLVALFVGGMVATRTSAIIDKATGLCEGVLVWVVSLAVMAHLGGSGAAILARDAVGVLGGVPPPSAAALQGDAPGVSNTATTTTTTANGAAATEPPSPAATRLRAPELAERVASLTGLSMAEARTMLAETAERLEAQRPAPAEVEDTARPRTQAMDRALAAQPEDEPARETPRYAWLTFVSMLLSLGAAVAGAMLGRSRAVDAVTTGP